MKTKISEYLNLIRIKHWVKNLLVFGPVIFSLNLFNDHFLIKTIAGFLSLSFVSVFIYIINDIKDKESDKIHPLKSQRPIPSGKVTVNKAFVIGLLFFIAGITVSLLNLKSTIILVTYLIMNILYTFYLKKIVILDIFIISIGFCLRILLGAVLIDVALSKWMLLATFSISLILGFGKRRHEIVLLKDDATEHREILGEYNKEILDIMIIISTGLTAISYALYTMDSGLIAKFGTEALIYTFPPVIYGLYRYLFIVYKKSKGGKPEEDLLTDPGILSAGFIWVTMIITILYFHDIFDFINKIDYKFFQNLLTR